MTWLAKFLLLLLLGCFAALAVAMLLVHAGPWFGYTFVYQDVRFLVQLAGVVAILICAAPGLLPDKAFNSQ